MTKKKTPVKTVVRPASDPVVLGNIQTPSQQDARPPMGDGDSPSILAHEELQCRVANLEAVVRRLMLVLPASAQADYGALLPCAPSEPATETPTS